MGQTNNYNKLIIAKQLEQIPNEVFQVWAIINSNQPVGLSTMNLIEDTIERYPQYFKEYLESRRLWKSIPNSVHHAYDKELNEGLDDIQEKYNPGYKERKKEREGKGLLWGIDEVKPLTKEILDDFIKQSYEKQKEIQALKNRLSDKYYKPYGVKKD